MTSISDLVAPLFRHIPNEILKSMGFAHETQLIGTPITYPVGDFMASTRMSRLTDTLK